MKVVCIGSGNVATHMAIALQAAGAKVVQVWSRVAENADKLALMVGAQGIADLDLLDRNADLYIISVKDDAIPEMAKALLGVDGLVVHTSGAVGMEVLSKLSRYGVFYPLQTFSKAKPITFDKVPLCLEAPDELIMVQLKVLCGLLAAPVYEIDSEKRRILHLSAVFACNFVNHLYGMGHEILKEHDLDFELLKPLILETAEKVQTDFPEAVQTGPAIRNDELTMSRHRVLLGGSPRLQEIYQTLSDSIKKTQQ